MDSVPFQTLSTITDNLEQRLTNLSDTMFKAPSELAKEDCTSAGRGGRRTSQALAQSVDLTNDEGSRSSKQGMRKSQAFMTDVEEPESRPSSRPPATCIEDVVIDYQALTYAPQPPPNCKTEDVLKHVSEGILEQWSHDKWEEYFHNPLSVAICNDLYWYFFLQELALARVVLADPVAAASQAKLEPSAEHNQAQEVLYRRVSDNYMELFWKVGLTMQTDDFFDRYTEAITRAIELAFETGLPDSAYQFGNPEFQGRLQDILVNWTTGVDPRRLRGDLKLTRPEENVPEYGGSQSKGNQKAQSKRNYGYFNAVGHSPLVASYMDRHGLKCQIGGTDHRSPVAVHRLRRLEVAVNEDAIKWRKKRHPPVKVTAQPEPTKKEKKQGGIGSHNMMTSVMPQIQSSCGMGTFSQKRVDEGFLQYLNS